MFGTVDTDLDADRTAVYIRRSTEDQEEAHQRADIGAWLDERELTIGDLDVYADQGSGAAADREEFLALQEAIAADAYDALVIWELSRLAREPEIAESFFAACEEHGVDIHITDGMLPYIPADYGLIRAFASFGVHMARQERERLIERTRSGQRRAREEGKWLGEVPAGFERDADGYLQVDLPAYIDIQDALEAVENGESYRGAADGTPVTRQTLSSIHQDEERRQWYLDGEADDDRVDEALGVVAHRHAPDA